VAKNLGTIFARKDEGSLETSDRPKLRGTQLNACGWLIVLRYRR
jgi:hypothetical protein